MDSPLKLPIGRGSGDFHSSQTGGIWQGRDEDKSSSGMWGAPIVLSSRACNLAGSASASQREAKGDIEAHPRIERIVSGSSLTKPIQRTAFSAGETGVQGMKGQGFANQIDL